MDPGEKVPRSPPRFADGQEEYFFAAIAKSAPPAISFLISRHLVLDLTKMCDALAVTLASQVVDAMQSVTRAINLNMFLGSIGDQIEIEPGGHSRRVIEKLHVDVKKYLYPAESLFS
jgi:hypothetical protein